MVAKKSPAKKRGEDRSLHYRASMLRSHCLDCRVCKSAANGKEDTPLCDRGAWLAIRMAVSWNLMLEYRKAAGPSPEGLIHACPDVAAHGESYALCAELYSVNGIQDRLF